MARVPRTVVVLVTVLTAATLFAGRESPVQDEQSESGPDTSHLPRPSPENSRTAVFAGGCFWSMEEVFEDVAGVIEAVCGYAGGTTENPTFYEVTSGTTGHAQVVQVTYDPDLVSYDDLLYVFWRNVDPLDAGGQFCDRGSSFRTVIFYETEAQRTAAEESRRELERSNRFDSPIMTEIVELDTFYRAESYHQDYYLNDPVHYRSFTSACGRAVRLARLWGEESGSRAQ